MWIHASPEKGYIALAILGATANGVGMPALSLLLSQVIS
jgi:hypothetical protein